VRSIIRTRYISGGGKLAYACVIGDPQNGGDSLNIATHSSQYDNYFGTGLVNPNGPDNPDPVPEVAVGRISVTNGFALQAVVDKTILYETAPYTGDLGWFTRTWCAAHIYAGASVYSLPSFKRYTEAIMRDHGIAPVLWTVFNGVVVADTIEAKVAAGISVFNHRMAWIGEMSTTQLDVAVRHVHHLQYRFV